jgi:hypothetical protein
MGHQDIEKNKKELINFVGDNKKDYDDIFALYDAKKCKTLSKQFTNFCLDIENCKDFTDKKMCNSIKDIKDLFYNIGKSSKLSKHQKVCVYTLNVYLTLLCESGEKCKEDVCVVNGDYESSRERTTTSDDSFSIKEGKVFKIKKSSSSEEKTNSSVCCTNTTSSKPRKSKQHKTPKCDDYDDESKSSTKDDCGPCKNICDTDAPYPFADAAEGGCCSSKGCNDGCGFGNIEDIKQLDKVSDKLKIVLKQLCMLKAILCEQQQVFVDGMNAFGVCDAECYLDCADINYQNKLLYVMFRQIDSLITQNNCVFNGTKDTQPIKVYLNCGKSLTLCIIDNVKFTFVQDCNKKYILINVGSKQYKMWYLNDCVSHSAAVCLLKQNCCTLKLILCALDTNEKMIKHWLNVSKSMQKCKIYGEDDCGSKSCSC